MSKFLKRIGTKKLAYNFDIFIHSISIIVNVPVRISVIWKRHKKTSETRSKFPLSPSIESTDINETLSMKNTLYQEKTGNFLKKSAELRVEAHTESKKTVKLAELKLDLIDFLAEPAVQKVFFLSSCADKKARIVLSVKGTLIGESLNDSISESSFNSAHHSEEVSFDHESEKQKKPPIPKGLTETTAEEKLRITNLSAKVSILEKENQQIRSEKEDLKMQFKLLVESSQKERENFCEHSLKLDEEIGSLKHRNRKIESKMNRYKGKFRTKAKEAKELAEELEVCKSKYAEAEKVQVLDKISTLKQEKLELVQEIEKLKNALEIKENEKDMLDNAKGQLQSLNLKYISEISALKAKITESQETLISASSEQNKKKIEGIVQELKKELEIAQNERDEALAKNTDLLINMQKIKTQSLENTEKLNQKIRQIEFDLQGKINENLELNERINEEIQKIKIFERKTLVDKEETNTQIEKINKNYQEALVSNDALSKNLRETERKFARNRSETEPGSYEKFQKAIQNYISEINKLKLEIRSLKDENKETKMKMQLMQEEFNSSQIEEGPAEFVELRQKLENSSKFFAIEKNGFEEKIARLRQENQILQEKIADQQRDYENEIINLKVKTISLEDSCKTSQTSNDFVTGLKEESFKQTVEMKKIEIKELKGLVMKLQEEVKNSERKYMDLKVSLANFDLEKENVNFRYREIQDQLSEYSNKYTAMEVEFFRLNEKLAKALNENNDYFNEIDFLKLQIFYLQNRRKRKNK